MTQPVRRRRRPKRAVYRKLISEAERELMRKESERGHVDPVTELGVNLRQQIPKGQEFIDWIADESIQGLVIATWLSRGFTWEEIRVAFYDLTHWRWLPPIDQLQRTYEAVKAAEA